MERLPLEIRQRICSFIDIAYQPSVHSFALTSKSCLEAATACLFGTIRISFAAPDQLHTLLDRCQRTFEQRQAFKDVRRLEIVVTNDRVPTVRSHIAPNGLQSEPTFEEELHRALMKGSSHKMADLEASMEQLTQFVAQLPGLSSIRYACSAPFPNSLLRHLHEGQRVLLEVDAMFPRYYGCCGTITSSEKNVGMAIEKDMELLTSPCLRDIGFVRYYDCRDAPRGIDSKILLRNVALLPPGVQNMWSDFSPRQHPPGERLIASSEQLPDISAMPESFALKKLKSLWLDSSPMFSENDVTAWEDMLDFTVVEKMRVSQRSLEFSPTVMQWSALKDFQIDFYHEEDTDTGFFVNFVPELRSLTLRGANERHTLWQGLSAHGTTLEQLHLLPQPFLPWSSDTKMKELHSIERACPELARLSVSLQRTLGKGNGEDEIAAYQIIGSNPNLQEVEITLVVRERLVAEEEDEDEDEDDGEEDDDGEDDSDAISNRTLPDHGVGDINPEDSFLSEPFPGPGGILRGVTNRDMRNHLINCAVDSQLAKSIFRCISEAKTPGARPLTRLSLRVDGAGELGQDEDISSLALVTEHLARSWVVIPHPDIDRVDELLVTEIDPPEIVSHSHVNSVGANRLPKAMAPVFRSIWPEKEEIGDWRKEWHSLPLA